MRHLTIVATLALGLTAAVPASAQGMDMMQFADGNNDGKVTMEEFTAFSEQGWGYFSGGADKVKLADLDPMAKPAFAGLTPDADGFVTHQAYMAGAPARFKAWDKDGDGTLSSAELNGAMAPAN
jgi:hypothetical protein